MPILFPLYLKEYKNYYNAAYNPVITFSKPDGSSLKVDSSIASMGQGIVFASLPKEILQNRMVSLTWSNTTGYSTMTFFSYILDGAYDRTDDSVDFQPGSGSTNRYWPSNFTKGGGYLSTIDYHTGTRASTTNMASVKINQSTEKYNTIMVTLSDAWNTYSGYFIITALEIKDLDGTVRYAADLSGSLTMEVTGTYADYGYIGSLTTMPSINFLKDRQRDKIENLSQSYSTNYIK